MSTWSQSSKLLFVPFSSTDGEVLIRLDLIESIRQPCMEATTCMVELTSGKCFEVNGTLQDVIKKMMEEQ